MNKRDTLDEIQESVWFKRGSKHMNNVPIYTLEVQLEAYKLFHEQEVLFHKKEMDKIKSQNDLYHQILRRKITLNREQEKLYSEYETILKTGEPSLEEAKQNIAFKMCNKKDWQYLIEYFFDFAENGQMAISEIDDAINQVIAEHKRLIQEYYDNKRTFAGG